jgi:hypothetical protein
MDGPMSKIPSIPADFNPNDLSFLASAFLLASGQEANIVVAKLAKIFKEMSLPLPRDGEFVPGKQLRADRLFLKPFGLVMAVRYVRPSVATIFMEAIRGFGGEESKKDISELDPVFAARDVVHDRILQPLVSIKLSKGVVLELRPGVRPFSGTHEEKVQINNELKKVGINSRAHDDTDFGTILDPKTGKPHHVIINRTLVSVGKAYKAKANSAPIQEKIFGVLSADFQQAALSSNPADWEKALICCRQIIQSPPTAQRILSESWGRVSEFTRAGERYEKVLFEKGHPAIMLRAA